MRGRDGRYPTPQPCPFCGRKFVTMEHGESHGPHGEAYRYLRAVCCGCLASGPRVLVADLGTDEAEGRAWEAWDMRR